MKRLIGMVALILLLVGASPTYADSGILVKIDGKTMTTTATEGYPMITEGRTLVPLRAIFEALGATLAYDPATRQIDAHKGERFISLAINNPQASVIVGSGSAQFVNLDVPPTINNSRTYVPLRFIGEALGCDVKYETKGSQRVISITTDEEHPLFYEPENIEIGDNIANLTVTDMEYVAGESIVLELKGKVVIKGVITGYYNEMYGENEFLFTPEDQMLDKPIEYTFDSGFKGSIVNIEGEFQPDGLLDQQTQNYILEGNELLVDATITGFRVAEKDESSGSRQVDIEHFDIIADEDFIGYVESGEGKKIGLENEIFTTTNQGDFYVDYADYRCVIIPAHHTINSSKTQKISVDFPGQYSTKLKFTVFGEIQDVQINYVPYMGEEGQWKDLGLISNSTVEINASLPTDMSSVIVHGRYHQGEGYYEDFEFSLDDMRDLEEYDIIFF